jgi:hypothetical protein
MNTIQMYLDKGYITAEEAARLVVKKFGTPADDSCSMNPECKCEDCQSEHWSFSEYGRE